MRVSYSPGYMMPLPVGHRFPMGKYAALFEILCVEQLVRPADVMEPVEADWRDLRTVHTQDYLSDLAHGTLSPAAIRRLGLPWSPALVRRARLAVCGTMLAAEAAMGDGIAANLAGGTHHAFPDRGEGFCVLNDVAVVTRTLQQRGRIRRALVVDLDVHQGNGTAVCLAGDPACQTFSVHGAKNYPFHKERSCLDVGLADRTADAEYLAAVEMHLGNAIDAARPELVFYLAGVDVMHDDRFGRLALTEHGLALRERLVLQTLRERGLPVALVLSGGYAPTIQQTADRHAIVHREAARVYGRQASARAPLARELPG